MKKKKKEKQETVFLVIYSHRFGQDHWVYRKEKDAKKRLKGLKKDPSFEPERDEFVEIEEVIFE